MIECIIFDCDGTLVDSEPLCNALLVEELAKHNVDISVSKLLNDYRGWKLASILDAISQSQGVEFEDNFISQYRALELDAFRRDLKAIDGVRDALSQIPLPKCVASSGPTAKIIEALSVTKLSGYFGANIFSGHDINKWKPDPDLFLYAAHKMNSAPSNCVVVEDSDVGVLAAIRAGITCYYYNPTDSTSMYEAAISFKHMSDLPSLLAKA